MPSVKTVTGLAIALSILLVHPTVFTQGRKTSVEHWVGTWATAVVARAPAAQGQGAPAGAPQAQPQRAWAPSPQGC